MIKTTGSAFEDFIRDEYTTLVEVDDRIFSTAVDLEYSFADITVPEQDEGEGGINNSIWGRGGEFDGIAEKARRVTLGVFATDESASVQVMWSYEPIPQSLIKLSNN